MKTKILSLGNIYFQIDNIHYPLPNPIPLGKEFVGSQYILSPASSALIFARVCASLDMEPYFIGKMGNDSLGKEVADMVEKASVTMYPIISDAHQTNISINYINNEGESAMFVSGSANQSLEAKEIEGKINELLEQVEYLYLGGVFKLKVLLPVIPEIIKNAHKKNVKIILDHNRITNATTEDDKIMMKKIVEKVDYYFPSMDEATELWEESLIDDALKKISSVTDAVVAIKNGKSGSAGIENGNIVKVDAFDVEILNTVGAGDSFNAGFIRAQIDGLSFERSLKFANATAALKISKEELPKLSEVKELCQKN